MIIALLGRSDFPTDAVEDYCRLLGSALEGRGANFALERVAWDKRGWLAALRELWRTKANCKGNWVLVQYTALMWSHRGFPFRFLLVLAVLRMRRARIAVVFHDSKPYPGTRLVDKIRRFCQCQVMSWAYRFSDRVMLTIPLDWVPWLPQPGTKASFIPVGANLPVSLTLNRPTTDGDGAKTITVFAVTCSGDISKEVGDIAHATIIAAERLPRVRLVTVGRGSRESESRLREALKESSAEFTPLGVLPAEEVSRVLANSDVALFVRSPITTQRGSAIASIANGVPLVAFTGPSLPAPLAEAGVIGVPFGDSEKLAEATVRVLTDPQLWSELHERSRCAYEKYFAWEAVAGRFLEVLAHA